MKKRKMSVDAGHELASAPYTWKIVALLASWTSNGVPKYPHLMHFITMLTLMLYAMQFSMQFRYDKQMALFHKSKVCELSAGNR